jgi:hypothetical protein
VIDPRLLEQRRLAADLVLRLRDLRPSALDAGGVDLGPALEQMLYFALRDGLPARAGPGAALRHLVRRGVPAAAAAVALVPRGRPPAASAPSVLVLLRQPVHARLFAPVRRALDSTRAGRVVVTRVGAAAADRALDGVGPRIEAYLDRSAVRELLSGSPPSGSAVARAWAGVVPDAAGGALARHTTGVLPGLRAAALAIRGALRRTGASVVVTYDEVGRWGRLLAAAAAAEAVRSVDLPHAEAVDEVAMRGIAFDRIGVFGQVSAERVLRAEVAPERIVRIGSPALDALVERARGGERPEFRRVVFASQYVGGVMTEEVNRRTVEAVLEAVVSAAPCELVVVPHPVERDELLARSLASRSIPGVQVRRAAAGTLQDELIGAWLLVTGSSQSVIEATVVGVPSLTVNMTGGPDPVPYAAEGMALGAASAEEARSAIASLRDDAAHRAALEQASASIERHVGPLDGKASERAAALIAEQAGASAAR